MGKIFLNELLMVCKEVKIKKSKFWDAAPQFHICPKHVRLWNPSDVLIHTLQLFQFQCLILASRVNEEFPSTEGCAKEC